MRAARRILIVLVVLVALLVVVDRVGAWAAQRTVADQVSTELANHQVDSAPPEVTINRFPFLTQVAAGRYESITLRLRDVGSGPVRMPLVELTATGVDAPASTLMSQEGTIVAERVAGTATVGYGSVAELTELEGLELSPAADGSVRVVLPTEVADTEVTLVGTADVTAVDGAVQLQVTELSVDEESSEPLPPGAEPVVEELAQQLSVNVPLPALPYGLTIESVRAESAGLAVSVSATDVPLTG
jgi:hypothetical protein